MEYSDNGWESSARAWITDMAEAGDYSRRHVLDAPMMARLRQGRFRTALDVGCGEGRFCRMMRAEGIEPTGIDPAPTLLATAQDRDPGGRYLSARAEALPFGADSFDLVVSYLTLIDIDDIDAALAEMTRVLRPGGTLLIANLNSFSTAGEWVRDETGRAKLVIDDYLTPRAEWVSWRGISIRNWHRPMHRYMQALIGCGLRLVHFDEPAPDDADPDRADRFRRCPYFHIMEWHKS
ncbi:SAM-dependent methyltransferase [Pararhodobacter marinus]|uniref:SAM-dependent methyltransferase n=1 Tax=Pararhodobacter marinus TaxID=2184063 RepID=A0A2U2CAL8_9RHOB|nr:class I SAM-dependent methyltransferase [Pararhodobacter marinus]PWE28917.1 SAM-dependent methyltransferase [Pararhodobacter marinus]